MKIVVERFEDASIGGATSLVVKRNGELLGRIHLHMDDGEEEAPASEQFLDFIDCLIEWARQGKDIIAPSDGS